MARRTNPIRLNTEVGLLLTEARQRGITAQAAADLLATVGVNVTKGALAKAAERLAEAA